MKEKIAKSFFWIAWSRGVIQLASFVSTLAVARLLSPSDYGLMALVTAWTSTIFIVAELGMGATIIQFPNLDRRELNTCFWVTMGIAGVGYLALYAGAPYIADWFGNPVLSQVMRVGGLTLLITGLQVVPDSLLSKDLSLHRVSQADIIASLVTMTVTLLLAWQGAGVWALVAGALTMPGVKGVFIYWSARWWPGLRCGSTRLPHLLKYGLSTFGNRVGWSLYQQSDSFVLGKMAGDASLGLYAMGKELALLPVTKISSVVDKLAYPIMANLQDKPEVIGKALLRGIMLVSSLTFPICVGGLVLADDLVRLALGDKWGPAVPILRVLCLYALVRSIDVLFPAVLMARYRTKFLFFYCMVLLAFMPMAFLSGAWMGGALGVALAWVIVYPLVMSRMIREALAEVGLGWSHLWAQVSVQVTGSLLMGFVVSGVMLWLPAATTAQLVVRLLVGVAMGVIVYASAVLVNGGPLLAELKQMLGWLTAPSGKAVAQPQKA